MSKVWIYGIHSAFAALNNPSRVIHEARCIATMKERIQQIRPQLRITIVDNEALLRLTRGTHQGIALCADPIPIARKVDKDLKEKRILILDHLQDVNNIGSIIRSMVALNFTCLITSQRGTPNLEQCAIKSSCGAIERLKIFQVSNIKNAIRQLKELDFCCIGLDHRAATKPPSKLNKVALILGAEGDGMKDSVQKECDELIALKTNPDFPILNVSVAAAIAMHIINGAVE